MPKNPKRSAVVSALAIVAGVPVLFLSFHVHMLNETKISKTVVDVDLVGFLSQHPQTNSVLPTIKTTTQ
jgi:hypothetical protein